MIGLVECLVIVASSGVSRKKSTLFKYAELRFSSLLNDVGWLSL